MEDGVEGETRGAGRSPAAEVATRGASTPSSSTRRSIVVVEDEATVRTPSTPSWVRTRYHAANSASARSATALATRLRERLLRAIARKTRARASRPSDATAGVGVVASVKTTTSADPSGRAPLREFRAERRRRVIVSRAGPGSHRADARARLALGSSPPPRAWASRFPLPGRVAMVRFGLGARRSSPGESSSADPSTSSSGSGRASEPPRPVDPVSVTFEGASAFVGEVFYVTDARTGAALTGWPPAPPPRGFRSAERAPDLDGVVRSRDDDDVRAVVALGETRDDDADPLDPNALARSATRAHARRELGASAYFASRELAERWADCVRRPRGLRPDLFLRRRLARPSDVPVTPVGVASRPFGDAYANLCVGWGNPVVAARRGVATDDDQKEAASILLGAAHGDGERERAEKGADPDVAGDGHAARLGGLLTGYVGDAAACDASLRVVDPENLATWLAPEWERARREDSGRERGGFRSHARASELAHRRAAIGPSSVGHGGGVGRGVRRVRGVARARGRRAARCLKIANIAWTRRCFHPRTCTW